MILARTCTGFCDRISRVSVLIISMPTARWTCYHQSPLPRLPDERQGGRIVKDAEALERMAGVAR